VTGSGAPRTRSRERTRNELMQAGLAALHEQPVGDVRSQLRGNVIAPQAGRTTGAFYNLWDSNDAYRAEVISREDVPSSVELRWRPVDR